LRDCFSEPSVGRIAGKLAERWLHEEVAPKGDAAGAFAEHFEDMRTRLVVSPAPESALPGRVAPEEKSSLLGDLARLRNDIERGRYDGMSETARASALEALRVTTEVIHTRLGATPQARDATPARASKEGMVLPETWRERLTPRELNVVGSVARG